MNQKTKQCIAPILILLGLFSIGISFAILDMNTAKLSSEMEKAYETGFQSQVDEVYEEYLENKIKYLNEEVERDYKICSYRLEREAEEREQEEKDSYKNYVILNLDSERYSSNLRKIRFTVTNIGEETATYLKFDIKMYDSQGNVINTEWTNWTGNLNPKERCVVETFVDMYGNEDSYSVILSEKRDN